MSLKTRILGLAALLIIAAGTASWLAYRALSDDIVERWGQQVAEIQVRYDSARLLQSLEREIGLAQQMARSSALLQWAGAPDNPTLKARAIRQMESFRGNFRDNSYFVALRENGHYYYNNADNEYAGNQFRYVLDPDKPDDAWFFQLLQEGRDFHLNVNPDTELGVTKLWIDVLMRDDNQQVVGMVGTGLNLDDFLQDIVDIGQDGITTLFVDYNGAIQLYRDRNYIDFASIIKPEGQKNTVDLLFDDPQDKQQILGMLQILKRRNGEQGAVESGFVTVNDRKHLAGVAFLPAIGWFEITLLDLDTLIPRSYLWPLVAVFLASLLITLALFHQIIQSRILRPVLSLEEAVHRLRNGRFDLPYLPKPDNEIGRLVDHFEKMSHALRNTTRELEQQVARRTEELQRLARIDALTGLKNRRGLDEVMSEQIQRAEREQTGFGLLWLDIDHFKTINDTLGHQAGDDILCRVALWLKAAVRPYDHPGRWGGDEFVVLLSPCDPATLEQIACRIRTSVEKESQRTGSAITISVGGYFCPPGEDLDTLLRIADQALYEAKRSGRNRVCIHTATGKEIHPA
ncbi:sensor domain-containing diguanylate cyclase [Marinobacter daepoensis]|uniref:sensor domain-containing diguanylate cyclase n=1 Tax=Marinobacter daepoensis TaxID=262077 RepID=UPI000419B30A|nr:sensor domain-containing diguanylate cyclase [Marinobacter daepoensis]MBY6034503.1 diguanylate cyclase [Marinobacter daepoensis]